MVLSRPFLERGEDEGTDRRMKRETELTASEKGTNGITRGRKSELSRGMHSMGERE